MSRQRKRHPYRSQMTRRLLARYFLTLVVYVGCVVFGLFLGWSIVGRIRWQWDNPVYQILLWIKEYLLLVIGLLFFGGWGVITYYYISRPMEYLDEIVEASEKLTDPEAGRIVLPDAIKNVQDQMNLFREQALRNALLAKEAEQRKNDMIVYLAHDLKTPLTSVIGYLTLLRDEPQISRQLRARYTGIALEKAERLEDLINEFFDITRFSLTTLVLEPERTSLSRMLEQIVSEFAPILAEKELVWKADLAEDVEILCDRDKMSRVFDNLVRNAVNYSYPQTVISLSMRKADEWVEIRICNHGRTIPPEKLSHIFEQFFRVDASRASATGGAGLGLAIAKEIVELHGGSILAESENESITFLVKLPDQPQGIQTVPGEGSR